MYVHGENADNNLQESIRITCMLFLDCLFDASNWELKQKLTTCWSWVLTLAWFVI